MEENNEYPTMKIPPDILKEVLRKTGGIFNISKTGEPEVTESYLLQKKLGNINSNQKQ